MYFVVVVFVVLLMAFTVTAGSVCGDFCGCILCVFLDQFVRIFGFSLCLIMIAVFGNFWMQFVGIFGCKFGDITKIHISHPFLSSHPYLPPNPWLHLVLASYSPPLRHVTLNLASTWPNKWSHCDLGLHIKKILSLPHPQFEFPFTPPSPCRCAAHA